MAREKYNAVFTGPACPFAAELIVSSQHDLVLVPKAEQLFFLSSGHEVISQHGAYSSSFFMPSMLILDMDQVPYTSEPLNIILRVNLFLLRLAGL